MFFIKNPNLQHLQLVKICAKVWIEPTNYIFFYHLEFKVWFLLCENKEVITIRVITFGRFKPTIFPIP